MPACPCPTATTGIEEKKSRLPAVAQRVCGSASTASTTSTIDTKMTRIGGNRDVLGGSNGPSCGGNDYFHWILFEFGCLVERQLADNPCVPWPSLATVYRRLGAPLGGDPPHCDVGVLARVGNVTTTLRTRRAGLVPLTGMGYGSFNYPIL